MMFPKVILVIRVVFITKTRKHCVIGVVGFKLSNIMEFYTEPLVEDSV